MSSALPSVLRFEVYVCTARARSRGEWFPRQTGFRAPRAGVGGGGGGPSDLENCAYLWKKSLLRPWQIFSFSSFWKIEVEQSAKNVALIPFCTEQCALIRLLEFFEPINSQGKPAVGESERTEVWSYIKGLKSEVKLRAFGQINDLISSIDLQCTCTQSRILAAKIWRRSLQSRFREQFLSTSRFTDIKNGRLHGVTKTSLPISETHYSIFIWYSPTSV